MDYQKYIQNMLTYNALNQTDFSKYQQEDELIDALIQISNQKREIQLDNNRILQECLVPLEKDASLITPEIAEELRLFWRGLRISDSTEYMDRGVSHRINLILKEYYTLIEDWEGVLRQVFLIFYFEMILNDHSIPNPSKQDYSLAEFLISKFDSFTPDGINHLTSYVASLSYHSGDPDGALDRFDYFLNYLEKHSLSLEDPRVKNSGAYFYALIDVLNHTLTVLNSGRQLSPYDTERFASVYHRLQQALRDPDYKYQQANAILRCMEASYLLGEIPLYVLLSRLNHTAKEGMTKFFADDDTYHFLYSAVYINYLNKYAKCDSRTKYRHCEAVMNHVLKVYSTLSKSADTFYITSYCAEFIHAASECMGFDRLKDFVLKMTVYADKALYLHTIMVKKIGKVLLTEILHTDPHFLDGVCEMSEDYIASHPMELQDVWNQCAMFHDIGKYYCIDYVSNSSRNLTDEEFRVIKDHPDNFDRFFAKSSGPIFDCIRACARLHHVWYNGKGGYPATAESTPNKPFVDILSIADSIDAATDIIGRPYTAGKTLDMLIEEFDTFRNTRYSAFVVDVLKRQHVKDSIQQLIHVERKHLNYQVYSVIKHPQN